MNKLYCQGRSWTVLLASLAFIQAASADCVIAEETKQLDPVEVGFCQADAVLTGNVQIAMETIRAYTDAGSSVTKHFRIQRSTVLVKDRFKGVAADKITLVGDMYTKENSFLFKTGETYLIFAKRLPADDEFSTANAACTVQPTLLIADAKAALKQLEQHQSGKRKIDCAKIRTKDAN
jgi:hypothetical protein